MDAETSFVSQVAKIKRRIAIRTIHRVLLNASLIFLCISASIYILTMAGFWNHPFKGMWYFLSMGLSLSGALFITFITRSSILTSFIEIDHRLGLQDRLSTAYEYLISVKKTEFADLLMKDAAAGLQHFSPGQLVPARFSRLHLAAFFLFLINVLLYSGIFDTAGFRSTRRNLKKIENAGKILHSYMIRRVDDHAGRQSNSKSEYTRKLNQFSSQLNDSTLPAQQRYAALRSILKEVQGEQARLTNELEARLESADIKNLPVQKIPDLANLSTNQLEKLKTLLNKTLPDRVPDSINHTIESLQDLENMEKLLARFIDDWNEDQRNADHPAAASGIPGQSSQPADRSESPTDVPPPAQSISQYSEPGGSTDNSSVHSGSAESRAEDNGQAEEKDQPGGNSTAAGRAKSNSENRSGAQIEKSPGTATQDQPASARAKSYLIHIRALTDIGEARMEEDEIFRKYRRRVESILQKEEIPRNYREYIKNYFISVGIQTED